MCMYVCVYTRSRVGLDCPSRLAHQNAPPYPHHSGLKGMSEAEADAQLSKFIIVFKYLQVGAHVDVLVTTRDTLAIL